MAGYSVEHLRRVFVWDLRWMGWATDDANLWSIGLPRWVGVGVSGSGGVEVGWKVERLSKDIVRAGTWGGVEAQSVGG